jgi:hypothetical protein
MNNMYHLGALVVRTAGYSVICLMDWPAGYWLVLGAEIAVLILAIIEMSKNRKKDKKA